MMLSVVALDSGKGLRKLEIKTDHAIICFILGHVLHITFIKNLWNLTKTKVATVKRN